jgi:hypothetical protein
LPGRGFIEDIVDYAMTDDAGDHWFGLLSSVCNFTVGC